MDDFSNIWEDYQGDSRPKVKKSKGSKEINICEESESPYGHKVQ
jgi:hypothetical protein